MNRVSDVDIRLLRVFMAVAEAGGYAAAQARLDVGTSTISLHMSDLEKRIGVRLCERGRAGFSLTEEGRQVLERTRLVLNALDDFSGALASLKQNLTGRLRLGMVDSLVTHPDFPLVKAIEEFNREKNDVMFELHIDDRLELERRVLAHDLHAAISPHVRNIDGLSFMELLRERHQLYCHKGHPLFGNSENIDPVLGDFPFVSRSHHGRADLDRFSELNIRAVVNNMEAMLVLILSGSYIGLLPDHLVESWVEKEVLWPLNTTRYKYTSRHSLVVANTHQISLPITKFIPLLLKNASARGRDAGPLA